MTDNLVTRLRYAWQYGVPKSDLGMEAADRIETLSAARTDLCERIEALEAALREIAELQVAGDGITKNIARLALEGK